MILNSIKSDTNWGEAASAINDNFSKTNLEISKVSASSSKFKGFYTTEALLLTAIPSPIVGDNAWVGASYPGVVYVCNTSGTWTATATVPTPPAVDLTDYYDKAEIDSIVGGVETNIDAIETNLQYQISKSNNVRVTQLSNGIRISITGPTNYIVLTSGGGYYNVPSQEIDITTPNSIVYLSKSLDQNVPLDSTITGFGGNACDRSSKKSLQRSSRRSKSVRMRRSRRVN